MNKTFRSVTIAALAIAGFLAAPAMTQRPKTTVSNWSRAMRTIIAILVIIATLALVSPASAYTDNCEDIWKVGRNLAIFRDRQTSLDNTLKGIGLLTNDAEAADQEKALARFLWSTHLASPDWPAAAKIWCIDPASAAALFK